MNTRNHAPMAATVTSPVKTSSPPSTSPSMTTCTLPTSTSTKSTKPPLRAPTSTPISPLIHNHISSNPSRACQPRQCRDLGLRALFVFFFVKSLSLKSVENRPVKTGGVVTRAMAGESTVVAVPGFSIELRGKRSFIVGVADDKGYGWAIANAPLQKELTADEFRNDATFLVSPLASAITGYIVYVDNGLNIMGLVIDISAIPS